MKVNYTIRKTKDGRRIVKFTKPAMGKLLTAKPVVALDYIAFFIMALRHHFSESVLLNYDQQRLLEEKIMKPYNDRIRTDDDKDPTHHLMHEIFKHGLECNIRTMNADSILSVLEYFHSLEPPKKNWHDGMSSLDPKGHKWNNRFDEP